MRTRLIPFIITALLVLTYPVFAAGSKETGPPAINTKAVSDNVVDRILTMSVSGNGSLYINDAGRLMKYTDSEGWKGTSLTSDLPSSVTSIAVDGDRVICGLKNGIALSVDSGATWEYKNRKDRIAGNVINSVAVEGSMLAAASNSGLSLSFDSGITWKLFTGYEGLSGEKITNTAILKQVIYAICGDSLNISYDKGENWERIPMDGYYGGGHIKAIAIFDDLPTIVYDESCRSWNGESWIEKASGGYGEKIIGLDDYALYKITPYGDPNNNKPLPFFNIIKSENDIISFSTTEYSRAEKTGRSYDFSGERWFKMDNFGLLYSDNNGTSWHKSIYMEHPGFLYVDGKTIYSGTYDSLLRSIDYGENWEEFTGPEGLFGNDMVRCGDSLFFSTCDGLFKSGNEGEWEKIEFPFVRQSGTGDLLEEDGLLLYGTTRGLLISSDCGKSWFDTGTESKEISLFIKEAVLDSGRIAVLGGRTVVHLKKNGSVLFSISGTGTWASYITEEAATQRSPQFWTADDMLPVEYSLSEQLDWEDGDYYREAGTFDALSFSKDGGKSWIRQDIKDITGDERIPDEFWEEEGILYLSFYEQNKNEIIAELWVSDDWGGSWAKSENPLADKYIKASGLSSDTKWAIADDSLFINTEDGWSKRIGKLEDSPRLGEIDLFTSSSNYVYLSSKTMAEIHRYNKNTGIWDLIIPPEVDAAYTYDTNSDQLILLNGELLLAGSAGLYSFGNRDFIKIAEKSSSASDNPIFPSGDKLYNLTEGIFSFSDDHGRNWSRIETDDFDFTECRYQSDSSGGMIILDKDNNFYYLDKSSIKKIDLPETILPRIQSFIYNKGLLYVLSFDSHSIVFSSIDPYSKDKNWRTILTEGLNYYPWRLIPTGSDVIAFAAKESVDSPEALNLSYDHGKNWQEFTAINGISIRNMAALKFIDNRIITVFNGDLAPGISSVIAVSENRGLSWKTYTPLDYHKLPIQIPGNRFPQYSSQILDFGRTVIDDEGRIFLLDQNELLEVIWN